MAPSDDKDVFLCMRTNKIPHIKGCIREFCTQCRHPVWVSPASARARSASEGYVTMCEECFETFPKTKKLKPVALTKEQISELRKNGCKFV